MVKILLEMSGITFALLLLMAIMAVFVACAIPCLPFLIPAYYISKRIK